MTRKPQMNDVVQLMFNQNTVDHQEIKETTKSILDKLDSFDHRVTVLEERTSSYDKLITGVWGLALVVIGLVLNLFFGGSK